MSLIVVGLNHRTAPLEILERVSISAERLPKALASLRTRGTLDEVVVLSTCMRTEVYATADRFHPAVQDVRNFLCESSFSAPEDLSDHLTILYDDAAIAHLFTVVCGADSAVLGESEIQGQVRRAWESAQTEGASGPMLASLFRRTLEVGKRVRTETAIGRGTTSVSQAAVALAERHLGGSLAGRRALVLGAGEMGTGMAVALAGAGASAGAGAGAGPGAAGRLGAPVEVRVANRTGARARELAERIGGRAIALADLRTELESVDVLLTSTTSPTAMVSVEDVVAALRSREGRPLLIVDVAIPRDVEAGVAALDDVTVLDLDDLRAFASAGLAERRRELDKVRGIIGGEVAAYERDLRAREVAPTIAALRAMAEDVRAAELERYRARLDGLSERERDAVDAVTKGIVAKLLHEPSVQLRSAASTPKGERLSDALRTLFGLDS